MLRSLAREWIALRLLVGLGGVFLRGGGAHAGALAIFLDRASHVAWVGLAARRVRALR